MCGIVGFVNRSAGETPLGKRTVMGLKRAMVAQKHRGPDDDGAVGFRYTTSQVYEDSNPLNLNQYGKFDGLFGFNRLSIKDLSIAGHQPMISSDKKVILVFNGEIYNDKELRDSLLKKGYAFKSETDTEVILNLYLELGFRDMLPLLNGMFAIAIMDLRTQELHLARDRFGVKPLYYSLSDSNFIFASELKCFIQFDEFSSDVDIDAFNARLVFARPSSKVLLKNVKMMSPGQALTMFVGGGIALWDYFDIDSYKRDDNKFRNLEEALEALDEILSDAVKRQLVSDVKVGCQVSGGIDSSIVSLYANKAQGTNLKDGVSIIDDMGEDGEEFYINQVGAKLNLNLHKFKMTEALFAENYEKLIWYNDAPLYMPYFTPFYTLTKGAKEHVTVLLSGEGADEIAGGYGRFAAGVYQPFFAERNISGKGLKCYKSYAEYAVLSDAPILDFTTKGYTDLQSLIDEQIVAFNNFTGSNFAKQLKYETVYRLPESFMRQDKMSMANSIENRVPLVDNKVADFLMELPENMLLRFKDDSPVSLSSNPFEWVHGKYILKELCARKFGRDFAYRKKAIMAFDDRNMLSSSGFKEIFYEHILPSMKKRDLVDWGRVQALFENVLTIPKNQLSIMWRAIGLETWCQLFLDKRNIITV